MYIYIYIYICSERERERDSSRLAPEGDDLAEFIAHEVLGAWRSGDGHYDVYLYVFDYVFVLYYVFVCCMLL